ncbi:MAG: DUF4286 family protein [Bacteroidetes bacterium]|nr:DUF4286 family protein [Bacteroidota bacterium]
MILYVVSVVVPKNRADEWEAWMTKKHIADVVATGKFKSARLLRVLIPESTSHIHFSVQYLAETIEQYDDYRIYFAPKLQADHTAIFGTSVTASREVLEEIKVW